MKSLGTKHHAPSRGRRSVDASNMTSCESERLQTLDNYNLRCVAKDPILDDISRLSCAIFNVDTSLVTIVGSRAQAFRGSHGLNLPGTAREVAFCEHAIRENAIMVVQDASKDNRFYNNPLVTGPPFIRFYAGCPLFAPGGKAIGTLCIIDPKPRQVDEREKQTMSYLARVAMGVIEAGRTTRNSNLNQVNSAFAERVRALPKRQSEVLHALTCGCRVKDIAFQLSISERTVKMHKSILAKKFETNSTADLIRIAVQAGM